MVPPLPGESMPPIEANYGLLLPTEDGYTWVCHEALTEPKAVRAPRYVRNRAGVWLATLSDVTQGRGGATLFRSPDGCAWNDVTGIDKGTQVAAAAFDSDDDQRAWAVSNTVGVANRIYTSTDGGASWQPAIEPQPDRVFHSVGGATTGWATATNHAGTEGWFWRESGTGEWTETPVAMPKGTKEGRFAMLDAEGSVRWAVIDPIGSDTLLYSDDGGAAFSVVPVEPALLQDGAIVGSDLWLVRDFGVDLVQVSPDGTTVPLHKGALPSFGLTVSEGQGHLAVLSFAHDALLQSGPVDGAITTRAFPDDVTGPHACPAGTEGADICAPLWSQLEPSLRGFDGPVKVQTADTGLPNDDDGSTACGCGTSPVGPVWGLAVVAWMMRRRQR